MRNHYQQAMELLRRAENAPDPAMAALYTAQAQVHATLALVDATREAS